MKKETNGSRMKIVTCVCDQCHQEKPALGFTNLVFGENVPSKTLCQSCCNMVSALRMSVRVPSPSEFSPVSFFDSIGKEHTFYFQVRLSTGLGIIAQEINECGEPFGYEFSVMQHPDTPTNDVYSELITKIKKGLSVRYLQSSDFGYGSVSMQNRLYLKDNAVVGRIEENGDGPTVVVDGIQYTWEELGQFLSSQTGFNFRLECFDPYEEIDFSSKVERPDLLWWLPKLDAQETEKDFH